LECGEKQSTDPSEKKFELSRGVINHTGLGDEVDFHLSVSIRFETLERFW